MLEIAQPTMDSLLEPTRCRRRDRSFQRGARSSHGRRRLGQARSVDAAAMMAGSKSAIAGTIALTCRMGGLCAALRTGVISPDLQHKSLAQLQNAPREAISGTVLMLAVRFPQGPRNLTRPDALAPPARRRRNSPQTLAATWPPAALWPARDIQTCCVSCLPGAVVDMLPRRPGRYPARWCVAQGYDGITITGSSLHVYNAGPEVMRQIDLARAALKTDTPLFGSCWGLQVLTAAAGGSVRKNSKGRDRVPPRNFA